MCLQFECGAWQTPGQPWLAFPSDKHRLDDLPDYTAIKEVSGQQWQIVFHVSFLVLRGRQSSLHGTKSH
jgi:hypothetical protein